MTSSRSTRRLATCLLWLLAPLATLAEEASSTEIDAQIWHVISRTVAEHDIEGMAAVYHSEAVLVHGKGTVPIATQLASWGEDMEQMRTAGTSARVSFRFGTRQDDEQSAFETGIFRYSTTDASGAETASYVGLETLLIKKDGAWLIVMERQLGAVDESAWNALQ